MVDTPSSYEWTPFVAYVPAEPVLEDGPLNLNEIDARGEVRITGLNTVPFEMERSRAEAETLLRRCRESLRRGNRFAITELLDANPAFIVVPWVAEELLTLRRGGLSLRRRGRVRGVYRFHPLVVAGLVRHLIARGDASNVDRALQRLAELGLMSYDTAKDLYYRARRNDRFKSVLIEFPQHSVRRSTMETTALVNGAARLRPGGTLRWKAEDLRLGPTEVTIKAD
jgi:hypothetical protein